MSTSSTSTSGPLSQVRRDPPVHDGNTIRREEKQPPPSISISALGAQRAREASTLGPAPRAQDETQDETESCWLVCCLYSVFVAPLVALWNCLCCCCCTREPSRFEGNTPEQISDYINGQNGQKPGLFTPDDQGIPPVRYLAERGLRRQIEQMVRKVDPGLGDALFTQVCDSLAGDVEINRQAKDNAPLTHYFFQQGFYEVVLLLLQAGADVNAVDVRKGRNSTLLHLICGQEELLAGTQKDIAVGHRLLIEWVLDIPGVNIHALASGQTPAHLCIRHGRETYLHCLIAHHSFNAEVRNRAGDTLILAACRALDLSMVKGLRRCGANLHEINDKTGDSCLHIVCAQPEPEQGDDLRPGLIIYLRDLEHRVPISFNSQGFAPQHVAAWHDHYGLFGPLSGAGANLKMPTRKGKSPSPGDMEIDDIFAGGLQPIHLAAVRHAAAAVTLLVRDHKVDVNQKSRDGETPLALAFRDPFALENAGGQIPALETVAQLLHMGANPDFAGNGNIDPLLLGEKGANAKAALAKLQAKAGQRSQVEDGKESDDDGTGTTEPKGDTKPRKAPGTASLKAGAVANATDSKIEEPDFDDE